MKKIKVLAIIAALACLTAGCSDEPKDSSSAQKESSSVSESSMEETSQEEPAATEAVTEPASEPGYFSTLVFPDTMTEKEKSSSGYRELSVIYPEKAEAYGLERSAYGMHQGGSEYVKFKQIQENVRELKVYDEQFDTDFLVHITLPPDYDENREYPVFFICDSEYWLYCVPDMWKLINEGEAAPVIFVTLGHDYNVNGAMDDVRFEKFVLRQEEFLGFITDELMPLISMNYKTDPSRSVLFGHSLGGVFSHYALCNADRYADQPFANYIIASPAFWTYHYTDESSPVVCDNSSIKDPYAFESEFGFFERNSSLDKKVFICAGGSEYYRFDAPEDLATIPEDAEALYNRMTAYSADVSFKLYEGKFHTGYVPDMFKEYMTQYFPPEYANEN